MRRYFLPGGWIRAAIALLAALAGVRHAAADVVDADVVPQRAQIVAGVDATVPITWQVTVDLAGDAGADSPMGFFVNATTGAQIAPPVATQLFDRDGRGLIPFPELVTVDGDLIASWLRQGIRRVGYRRTFTSPGSTPRTAQLLLSISGSTLEGLRDGTSAQLQVLRMELAFTSGNRIEIAEPGQTLAARLTLGYGGSGTLRGRWQIAEPGGGSRPFFRTLALVRETLAPVQRAVIESPPLPTHARGRYVLRFCLEAAGAPAEQCVDSSSSVQTLYEVMAQQSLVEIVGLQPNGLAAGPQTPFRWAPVPGATTYQLQVFSVGAPDPGTLLEKNAARLGEDGTEREMRFVTGLLIPADAAQTLLTDLVRSRLEPGQRYVWRVTAHDADGQLIARSRQVSFIHEL
jgi:hypothetical protein